MKKLSQLLLLVLVFASSIKAQNVKLIAESKLNFDVREYLLSDGQRQFYLTSSGDRLLINSDLRYTIVDPKTGDELASGEHLGKVNSAAQALGVQPVAGGLLNFDEGSAFYVLEDENKVLFLDWNANNNIVKMVSLEDGSKLWENNSYQIAASLSQQMMNNVIGGGASLEQESAYTRPQVAAEGMAYFGDNLALTNNASAVAQNILLHLPESKQFVLKTANGLVGFSSDTGDKIWEFNEDKIQLGAILSVPGSKDIIFINNYESALGPLDKSNKNNYWIARINGSSGEQMWKTLYENRFIPGRTHIDEELIYTDYSSVVCYNINTGEKSFDSNLEEGNIAQNTAKVNFSSVFNGSQVYETSYLIKGISFGGWQTKVHNFNVKTGEKLWESEWLPKRTELYYLTGNKLMVETSTGIAKTSLIGLDANSGKQLFTTEEIKHYWFRNGAGAIFSEDAVYISGKNETRVYNPSDFSLLATFDTKAAEIGKLQAMFNANNEIAYVGDKGVAFFNKSGEVAYRMDAKRVEGAFWNNKGIFVLDKNDIKVLNINRPSSFETLEIPYDDKLLYFVNQQGDLMSIIDAKNELIKIYQVNYSVN